MTTTVTGARRAISTITISMQTRCPSVVEPRGPFRHNGKMFSETQLRILGEAIDAGMFYQDDVKDFCKEPWLAAHPLHEVCLTRTDQCDYVSADSYVGERALVDDLRVQIQSSPRGTWALVRLENDRSGTPHVNWTLFISDGDGEAHACQTAPIWINERRAPTYADAVTSLVGMEIYRANAAECARREQARSGLLVVMQGWAAGTILKNIKIDGKAYSTGHIVEIAANGWVTIMLTKRGSSGRWRWSGLAQRVEGIFSIGTLPAFGSLVATQHHEPTFA